MGKIHHIAKEEETITTTCGRIARLEDHHWVHNWDCAKDTIVRDISLTHQKNRVTCRTCIKKFSES